MKRRRSSVSGGAVISRELAKLPSRGVCRTVPRLYRKPSVVPVCAGKATHAGPGVPSGTVGALHGANVKQRNASKARREQILTIVFRYCVYIYEADVLLPK